MPTTAPRQPIFNIPAVVIALIVGMAAIQGIREKLSDRLDAVTLARLAFVPGRFTYTVDPAAVLRPWTLSDAQTPDGLDRAEVARFFLGDGSAQPWTPLTYALLHGSWTHLGLNTVWLLAFGTPLARRLGVLRFLLFTALGAVAGAAAHFAASPISLQPLVGASAAVSACMAGALRFMFGTPAASDDDRPEPAPPPELRTRVPLVGVFRDRRSLAFVIVWFLTNIVTGLASGPLGFSDAPIAWQAHIGGFLFGLLGFPLFDRVGPLPAAPETGVKTSV